MDETPVYIEKLKVFLKTIDELTENADNSVSEDLLIEKLIADNKFSKIEAKWMLRLVLKESSR